MNSTVTYLVDLGVRTPYPTLWRTTPMQMTDLVSSGGDERVAPHLTSLL